MVVVVFAVLKPWNKIIDAMITLVEKPTKYVGLTLHIGSEVPLSEDRVKRTRWLKT